ncbi:MAG: WbqC family protein, partial [Candidatus Omnitrophica bacterium]|nr:WbqC family protein [Candidatus Omnitrophota bacterium]
ALSDCFVFLDKVQYKPREFQNRNKIRTKDGWIWLTVPVISKGRGRQKMCEVEINNDFDWRKEHLKSLEVNYGGCEFFEKYIPFFKETYSEDWQKLADLNVHIIRYLLEQLEIKTPLRFESEIGTTQTSTDRIIEICKKLKADVYLSGAGGKEYLEEDKFQQAGIKLVYQDFKHPVYQQRFAKTEADFLPYMSAIDLLFNSGPKAKDILLGEGKNP